MVIVGSTAAKFWFPDFREPKDIDIITDDPNFVNAKGQDHIFCPPLLHYLRKHGRPGMISGDGMLEPSILYTLKMSHIFWDRKWDKHFADIQFFKSKGCKLIWPLFYNLYQFWQEQEPLYRSDLQMSSENFFNNALPDGHLHDELHLLINPNPAYKQILIGEVETSDELFFALPDEEKARIIVEEVMVMAYERQGGRIWYHAYAWMLKKFLRQHSPIRQAIWGIENFDLIKKPFFNFVKHIDNAKAERKRIN